MKHLSLVLLFSAVLGACSTPPSSQVQPVSLSLGCPTDPRAPAASYVGPYKGVENLVPLQEQAQDILCADRYKEKRFPKGFVAIYGSSRIREKNERCQAAGCDNSLADANDRVYADIRTFARLWTERFGKTHPVMTGAGPGLMEAGNRGAREAGGDSIGYTTYYDPASAATAAMPYGGDPSTAFNPYVTGGLIFSSVAIRESVMIKHSAAIVLAPGGTGTEWETFQVLEMIKGRQLARVGVYVFGNRATHWASLDQRLQDMYRRKTVRPDELAFIRFVESPAQLVELIAADLGGR